MWMKICLWRRNEEDQVNKPNWVGVLVGSSISPELQRKLADGYQTEKGIPIAEMVIRRFRSQKNEFFVTTDTFFKFNYTTRDFSKFADSTISTCTQWEKGNIENFINHSNNLDWIYKIENQ